MKIGILTFHDGLNHGAFLQAFSTMTYLNTKFDHVQIINYKNKYHHRQEGWKHIFKYFQSGLLIFCKKKYLFQRIKKN